MLFALYTDPTWGIGVTETGAATFRSGFRLHAGGPFPTSRALEAQSSAKAARVEASVGAAPRDEVAGRVTKVGGSASLLVVPPGQEVSRTDFATAASAYREASDATTE